MIDCLTPVQLKSGVVVGCGKCPNCRSRMRNQWSIRLQVHTKYHSDMPMMIGLSYDNDHLIYGNDAIVYRPPVSAFLKAYKRKYNLKNDKFTYFGCSEYGDTFGRPHVHLLFFGDSELQKLFWQDTALARKHLEDVWTDENGVKRGNCWVSVADWPGIHYVCKYILKDGDNCDKDVPPFIISSNNLGVSFFDSEDCAVMREKVLRLQSWRNEIYAGLPELDYDLYKVNKCIEYMEQYVPKFTVVLDNNREVFLPRYFTKRIMGVFDYWSDNPLWLYKSLLKMRESLEYQQAFPDSAQLCRVLYDRISHHCNQIKKRQLEQHYNKQFKTFRK